MHFHLYLQKSIKISKKREEAEPQGQALAKRTCRGGETNKQKNVISKERRAMQAGSGGNIDRVEKQLGLNLQVGGGRLKLYRDIGLLMSNVFHLKHVSCRAILQNTKF